MVNLELGRLSPNINTGGATRHHNHNVNSNLNGANNHNMGNRGSHSNSDVHSKFRNNRVPLCHHLPGFNFADEVTVAATRIHLSRLGGVRNSIIDVRALGTTGLVHRSVGHTHMVLSNRIAGTCAFGNVGIAGNTGRTVRTTNNDVRR